MDQIELLLLIDLFFIIIIFGHFVSSFIPVELFSVYIFSRDWC